MSFPGVVERLTGRIGHEWTYVCCFTCIFSSGLLSLALSLIHTAYRHPHSFVCYLALLSRHRLISTLLLWT